jgi:hypothetical protein
MEEICKCPIFIELLHNQMRYHYGSTVSRIRKLESVLSFETALGCLRPTLATGPWPAWRETENRFSSRVPPIIGANRGLAPSRSISPALKTTAK